MAVYDALVRMAQDFSMRYPLVDGQGNFGSVDGDAPAAMRYTEARLSKIAESMLEDIERDTVDFVPNFDESLKEPLILPARLPNLLVNGSAGIAVGMATNIPPHNLREVCNAICALIDDQSLTIKDLMKHVKGPDFPTAGTICGKEGIEKAYETGRGSIKIRAVAHTETKKSGKEAIVVTELPYMVNKASLIESMANLVNDKKIEGISDIRDESDKDGLRISIDLKRDTNAEVVLNQLYKHTQLEETFGIIMLALDENRPKILNLKQVLSLYIEHRKVIVLRRTRFELDKAQRRAHILEGLKICVGNIDKVIKIIKSAKTPQSAKEDLIKAFKLTEVQAQAILEMQLQRLTGLERKKLEDEYLELIKKIEFLKSILESEKKLLGIIKKETQELNEMFGDDRRTKIVGAIEELSLEDLIAEEQVVVTISHQGYIKRLPIDSYRKQKRGGRGVTAASMKEEDFIEHLFIASTHDHLLIFTGTGQIHWLKVHEIPTASRTAQGKAIINLLEIDPKEQISSCIAVRDFPEDKYLFMVTEQGVIKKTSLSAYSHPRKGGIIGLTLEKGDRLIEVAVTDGKKELILASEEGKAIRFSEEDVRPMGRQAKGIRGMRLSAKDKIIGMEIVRDEASVLTICGLGFGKRTKFEDYRTQSRGGKGIINIKVTKKNGPVVGIKTVTDKDEIMVVTQKGMMVRCVVKEIRQTARSAQGVKIIKLEGSDRVSAVAFIREEEEELAQTAVTGAEPKKEPAQAKETKKQPQTEAASKKEEKQEPKKEVPAPVPQKPAAKKAVGKAHKGSAKKASKPAAKKATKTKKRK
jgi:DNA gyrase subunit A